MVRVLSRVALLASLIATQALANTTTTASLASPGSILSVDVSLDDEGRAFYTVNRRNRPVIAPSRLGFLLADAPKFERKLALASQATRSSDETWEQPWGERRFVRNRFNELRIRLTEKSTLARSIDVVFRSMTTVSAFVTNSRSSRDCKTVSIAEELTEFAVVDPATAWWIPAGEWNRYEYLYNKTPLD